MAHAEIINGISDVIAIHATSLSREEVTPQSDPDKMDATIKFHRGTIKELREIRNRLEELFNSTMPRNY